jgi:subtilisin family serine protease
VIVARSGYASFLTNEKTKSGVIGVAPTTGAGVQGLALKIPAHFHWFAELPKPTFKIPFFQLPSAPSGEPLASMQWNMDLIRTGSARLTGNNGKGAVVAVLDSGIDDTLPDLVGAVDHSKSATCIGGVADADPALWSYDGIGHGTHVAGIIGARKNGHGVIGVAPEATLAAIKVTDDGFVYPESVVCGLAWAANHGADIVNGSIFVDPWYYNCSNDPTQNTIKLAVQRAVDYAASKKTTLIAASSNESQDLANPTTDPFSPTDVGATPRTVDKNCKLLPIGNNNVIGVSAVGANGNLAYYSNYGLGQVDFTAPGGDLHVAANGNPSGQIVSPIPAYSFYYWLAGDATYGWNGRVGIGCPGGADANDPNIDPTQCTETYALLQGTSMSTPHAAGVAALIIARTGKLSPASLQTNLQFLSKGKSCPSNPYQPYPADMPAETCQSQFLGPNGFYGYGMVDAFNAASGIPVL